MAEKIKFWMAVTASVAIASLLSFSNAVTAQELRATGAILLDENELAELPVTPTYRNYLPEAIDLSNRMPSPGDQGSQGSCVAWAVGYAARSYYEFASSGASLEFESNIVSPAFIYDAVRGEGTNCDKGSRISDALDLLTNIGSLSSEEYTYNDQLCRTVVPTADDAGLQFQINGWSRVETANLDQIKAELAQGHPVILSMVLNRGFHQLTDTNAVWIAGAIAPEDRGGHAVTVVGYNDRNKLFEFINSWGEDWANGGFGFMDYETFEHRVRGAYVMRPLIEPRRPLPIELGPPPLPDVVVLDVDLPTYECASLRAERDGTVSAIRGFVASSNDLVDIQTAFSSDFVIDVDIRPWPQCEALLIVDMPGVAASIELQSTSTRIGDDLVFTVTTPDFSSYLHLAYFQADGQVISLFQSALPYLETHLPNTSITLGDGQNGYPRFEISLPVGNELILAITTRSPLFDRPRPLIETSREFLSALRAATIEMESNTGVSRYYAASYLPLEIVEN